MDNFLKTELKPTAQLYMVYLILISLYGHCMQATLNVHVFMCWSTGNLRRLPSTLLAVRNELIDKEYDW